MLDCFLSIVKSLKSFRLWKTLCILSSILLLVYSMFSTKAEWLVEYDVGGGFRPCGIIANSTIWFTTVGGTRSVIGNIAPSTGRITKYYLVGQGDLWDLVCGPLNPKSEDGSNSSFIWFVQRSGNSIGRFNPRNGESTAWPVPTSGSTPFGIAIHRYQNNFNNTLFFTEYDANRIGALRLMAGQWTFKEFILPNSNSRPVDITVDNEGYVWFTESATDRIGRLNPWDATFIEYPVLEGSSPWGITVDSEGFIWFTMSEASRIAKLDPRSGICESYEVPTTRSKPRHIRVDSYGSVWFTEHDVGKLAKYLPNYSAFVEYGFPNPDCGPDEITLGYQGEVWIAESRSERIARVLPSISATISTNVRTSTIETVSSTGFVTPTTVSRLTAVTFTSTLPTITTTAMATATSTTTATTSSTLTTTTTMPAITVTTTLTVTTTSAARACAIASAAYESELATAVQHLREFRDRQVASTFAGGQFLRTFDAFYYSFSPTIARCLRYSDLLREGARRLLYPLVATLHASSMLCSALVFCPELAVVVSGTVACLLVGLLYLLPLTAIAMCSRFLVQRRKTLNLKQS